jgi:hypothetical protein
MYVASGLFFAFILMLAGVFLFFLRKPAIWLFSIYLAWQLYKLIDSSNDFARPYAVISFALLSACLLYCVRLNKAGRMR